MISQLASKFNGISFVESDAFIWSPKDSTIYYHPERIQSNEGKMAILHEIAHSLLAHKNYLLDIELLNMEVAAWARARKLAKDFSVSIDEVHINDCLDSYRLWLYKRSRCPNCQNTGFQQDGNTYRCFICFASWRVAASHTLRPRRMQCKLPSNTKIAPN